MFCPKCGYQQEGGTECLRCGIIFERYRTAQGIDPRSRATASAEPPPKAGLFRRAYRVFRWVSLVSFVVVVLLALRHPTPPRLDVDPEARQRLEEKLEEMRRAARKGQPYSLRMDEAEVNGWLSSNLAFAGSPTAKGSPKSTEVQPEPDPPAPSQEQSPPPTVGEVQSSMRDLKVDLLQDRLRAFVRFDFHGKDLTLVLEGKVFSQDGYLRFEPLGAMLGSLPIPKAAIDGAVRRMFESEENREKFRLPPEIQSIRLEAGELIVTRR